MESCCAAIVHDVRLCTALWQTSTRERIGPRNLVFTVNSLARPITSRLPVCKILWLLVCTALVGACGSGDYADAGRYANYLERLASQLGDLPSVDEPTLQSFPSQRELNLSIERQVIDVAEFARLHACDLGDLVGTRNSPLGRVAGPVALLMQDQRWLRLGPGCVGQGQDWLADVLAAKKRSLPQRFWNAVLAGDEFNRVMSTAQPLGKSIEAEANEQQSPDRALRDLLDHQQALAALTINESLLNDTLKAMAQGQSIGGMRQRWRSLRMSLRRAANGLNRESERLCRNNKPTPKAKILRQVFDNHYVSDLQPQFAAHYGADQATVQALRQLQQRLADVAPESFTQWYATTLDPENLDAEWQRTQAALRGHALAWQRLWTHCGMPLSPLAPEAAAAQD